MARNRSGSTAAALRMGTGFSATARTCFAMATFTQCCIKRPTAEILGKASEKCGDKVLRRTQ